MAGSSGHGFSIGSRARIQLLWLLAFAVGMAYVEAAVVVYLRLLYYPDGFVVEGLASLEAVPGHTLAVEIGREAATIVMLAAVALLSARRSWWERLAHFMWAFAIWDIFYYVWLYVLIDWPQSLMTVDVLFLIPAPWIAPVLLPVAISCLMLAASLAILGRIGRSPAAPLQTRP